MSLSLNSDPKMEQAWSDILYVLQLKDKLTIVHSSRRARNLRSGSMRPWTIFNVLNYRIHSIGV